MSKSHGILNFMIFLRFLDIFYIIFKISHEIDYFLMLNKADFKNNLKIAKKL
jgi:hypothetical protein